MVCGTLSLQDSGTKVQLLLKAHGLKKKKGFINSIVIKFKKVSYDYS